MGALNQLVNDVKCLEKHDKLILIAVLLLLLGAWSMINAASVSETESFVRSELIDLAILLLIADIIIHVGRLEKQMFCEGEKIIDGEKHIEREEKRIERSVLRKGK